MREVDPKTTSRAMSYEYYIDAPMPMVTIFKTMDVTHLVKLTKKGYSFNMLMCWCIACAAQSILEFYLLPVGKKLGVFSLGDTKTGMGMRTIVLPQSTAELLRQRKKNTISQWIFPNPIKPELPTSPNSAYNHLKALLKQAELPSIRFHDLRRTFATHALASGAAS